MGCNIMERNVEARHVRKLGETHHKHTFMKAGKMISNTGVGIMLNKK